MKFKLILVILISLMLFTACVNSEDNASDGQLLGDSGSQLVTYGVAGYITKITENEANGEITILVEGDLENNGAEYDKASVTVTNDTVIYNEEGSEAEMKNLELDQYVTVFFEGDVMELYPVQAKAKQINIVPEEALEFKDDPTEY
ncbi:MAG: DUF3221 domain-containing protein [Bacillota bacterium]|nr:DUF3221 domain-containing protein [Bacillota bacterium]